MIKDQPFFCSWSGGKDSCLALYYALQQGGKARRLLTMVENEERSKSHRLPVELLQKQAELLQIPLTTCVASWEEYEEKFLATIKKFKAEGINYGVFGDIDIPGHLKWVQDICAQADITAYHPLWQKSRRQVVHEFITAGFKAMIVVVNEKLCDKVFLGRMLDLALIEELEEQGVDPCGENGEFHTVVIGGPIFRHDLPLRTGPEQYHDGYWFLPVNVS